MELEVEVKVLEKQKALLERQTYIADKKAIFFDMMIDLARVNIRLTSEKTPHPHNQQLPQDRKETLVFTCGLSGLDRQAYYRSLRRSTVRISTAQQVVALVEEKQMMQPKIGGKKLYFMLKEPLKSLHIDRDKFFDILRGQSFTDCSQEKLSRHDQLPSSL